MKQYKISLYQIETANGPEWIAEYPELKYCSGSGKTQLEALKMAEDEKDFYLEALKAIGEESPICDKSNNYSGKFTVRVSKSLHEKAVMKAQEEGVSLNSLVAEALAERVYNNAGICAVKELSDSAKKMMNEQHEDIKRVNGVYVESIAKFGSKICEFANIISAGGVKSGRY